ncbi:MAG: hypothetical protein LBM78_03680 [Clostridiales bacterium]|jgi:hypothetical protein|nr:hypothetical protein [Clostridiales bacterium]
MTCLLVIMFQSAACIRPGHDLQPELTITSASEASLAVNQTYKLEYTAKNAEGGITVAVSGTGGVYNAATQLFASAVSGVFTLTVTAKNGDKTATGVVMITVILPIAGYTAALGADEYTVPGLTGAYGLTDGTNVGVRAGEAQSVKYPGLEDDAFNERVIDFETFAGAYAGDAARLDAVIAEAKSQNTSGAVKITLPNRTITINADYNGTHVGGAAAVRFDGFDGLNVYGAGAETVLMIDTPTAWRSAVSIRDCKNLRIQNVRVDYVVSPTLAGEVTAVDTAALSVAYKIPASFSETVQKLKAVSALGGTLFSVVEYDKYTLAPRENGNTLYKDQGYFQSIVLSGAGESITAVLTYAESYRSKFSQPRTGELAAFAFAMYGNSGFSVNGGENLYFEGCGLGAVPGMAFTAARSENLYINRFNMTLSRDRLMTATADGFHFSQLTGEVKITGCVLENSHDDALNIKAGYYYAVTGADTASRTVTLSRSTEGNPLPRPGDTIEVYDRDTLDRKGRLTVVSATGNALTQTVTVSERLTGLDIIGKAATITTYAPKLTFADNIIRNKRNRGVLVQVPGAVIENNAFKNVVHGAISLHTSLDQFNEATLPQSATVRGNKFLNCGYAQSDATPGDVSVFAVGNNAVCAPPATLTDASITNNYHERSGRAGVALRGAGSTDISGNLFYNTGRTSAGTDFECAVFLENAAEIAVSGNYAYYTEESETWAGVVTAGLTRRESVTLSGNTNLAFREEGGNVPEYQVTKTTATLNVDGNLADWTGVGHSVDMVGASLATGDSIEAAVYADVFGVEVCKLTWKDDGLYFALQVRDNADKYAAASSFWTDDCIEIFMTDMLDSPGADFGLLRLDGDSDTLQLAVSPNWAVFYTGRTTEAIVTNKNLANVVCVTTDNGYAVEAFMPWSLLPHIGAAVGEGRGVAIAFVFADADRDDIGRVRLQVSNLPHFVENYKTKTARMPHFFFVD